MCTVSWLHAPNGYQLLCNRDERHARKPASAPFVQQRRGVRFISPRDGDHGGSWIAVNEFGLTFCLLNRYVCGTCCGDTKADYRSRGLLLMDLVECQSLAEVQSRINHFQLGEFQPFTVAVLALAQPALLCHWTSRDLQVERNGEYAMPLNSSSLDQKGVDVCRRHLFEKMVAQRGQTDIQLLWDFHRSHQPVSGPYSPCMHREDAATVSFSWVNVASDGIKFCYFPRAPCDYEDLPLRRGAASGLQGDVLVESVVQFNPGHLPASPSKGRREKTEVWLPPPQLGRG